MKRFALFSLSFLVIFSVACSKESRGQVNTQQFFLFDTPELAKVVFSTGILSCPTADCIDTVGGLTTFTAYKSSSRMTITYEVGVCSMTVVGPDLILTNRHCVPEDLRRAGANCAHRIRFRLPATDRYLSASFDCREVVEISRYKSEDTADVDWALLRMSESTDRIQKEWSVEGVELNQTIQLYPVEYQLREVNDVLSVSGQLHKVTCRTSTSSWLPSYLNKLSALFGADQCSETILKGNSGSGIFDPHFRLIGVGSFGVDASIVAGNVFGGTNLACIPYFNPTLGPNCQ